MLGMEKAVSKSAKPPTKLQLAIAPRLRAVQAELKLTDKQMAELVGAEGGRTRWANWIAAANLPKEECMIALCERVGLSMDWIYRGSAAGIDLSKAIRLEARLRGIDPISISREQAQALGSELASVASLSFAADDLEKDCQAKQTAE